MEEMTQTSENEEKQGAANLMAKFGELPSGVQRVIIAVFLVLILVALMFLQRLIRTEEEVDGEAIPFETAAEFSAEIQQEA